MSARSRSIAFDLAAEYYDRTRQLGPAAQLAVTRLLESELRGCRRCLEIGVGTGRVALDLQRAGVAMVGIDLSAAMLRKLVEKAGGRPPFPLAVADATQLPMPDDSVDAGLVCHVLHLIDPWEPALAELARVVRPGGVVLIDLGGGPSGRVREAEREFWTAAVGAPRTRRFVREPGVVEGAMRRLGFTVRELPAIVERTVRTPEEAIARLEAGQLAGCWPIGEDVRRRAAARAREWARVHFGSLEAPQPIELTITWRAYRAPG
ncbi:MAG TPA: class I SAM-dependent methyltransferase [Candidatus Dormibacteraeota bacterium]|nr:class I SAM-dependent methyltransferase [Candidatus Dormibacteraeota bacterium]